MEKPVSPASSNPLFNPFKAALPAGRLQVGLWSGLSSNITVEVRANAGFDRRLLDTEYASDELPMVHAQLQAISRSKATPSCACPGTSRSPSSSPSSATRTWACRPC